MEKKIFSPQDSALIIAVLLIIFLALVYFIPCKNPSDETAIIVAITGALASCLHFIFGSTVGSQAKDKGIADTQSDLIDALQNSTPVQQQKN